MYYYDVALGSEKHWDSSIFTYHSSDRMPLGSLVSAPFGKKKKAGIIVNTSKKPTFATKELIPYDNIQISKNTRTFAQWYNQYYLARGGQAYSQLLPHYLTKKAPKLPEETSSLITAAKIPVTDNQAQAIDSIKQTQKPSILHGVTGAGKTRIYLSLILETLQNGQSVVMLYPEISLTSQLTAELEKYVKVIAFHSNLRDAERSKLWFRVATAAEPVLVIGPRSSLFLPHRNLGLVIVDEAHESTFKQETDIRYNGILAAGGLAKAHDAKLVIGSATPPITETELILGSGGDLTCLHEQAIVNTHKKHVHIIDRKDRSSFTLHPLISDQLIAAVQEALDNTHQSLLFINRRGTAKLTLCDHCGWMAECPDCELPMTYHHDTHTLLCHTCGTSSAPVSVCPECSHAVSLKSLGSKAIVDEVQHLFPDAKIARFDTDTAQEASFTNVYADIRSGKVDILIGTQQIAKGLDLPLLSVVGVLDADLSLHFPDYSSDERTFQLLAQVAGRVGRGHRDGSIFIQTLNPNNRVIQFATTEDWHAFRKAELQNRKNHYLPPFVYVAKLIFRHKKYEKALENATRQRETLASYTHIKIDGPLPSFIQKRAGMHSLQLHLKSSSRSTLLNALRKMPQDVIIDLDPQTFL